MTTTQCPSCGTFLTKQEEAVRRANEVGKRLAEYPLMLDADDDFESNTIRLSAMYDDGDILNGGRTFAVGTRLGFRREVEPILDSSAFEALCEETFISLALIVKACPPEYEHQELTSLMYLNLKHA